MKRRHALHVERDGSQIGGLTAQQRAHGGDRLLYMRGRLHLLRIRKALEHAAAGLRLAALRQLHTAHTALVPGDTAPAEWRVEESVVVRHDGPVAGNVTNPIIVTRVATWTFLRSIRHAAGARLESARAGVARGRLRPQMKVVHSALARTAVAARPRLLTPPARAQPDCLRAASPDRARD